MAEATTGNDLTGATQSTGIISRILCQFQMLEE